MRSERKKAGLTQTQLAKILGVTQSLIGQYERGELNPKYETIKKICSALGVEYLPTTEEERQYKGTKNIRAARESTGCTQERLAQLTGLSLSTIKGIENGTIEITDDHFDRISRALGIRANQLYDLDSHPVSSGLDSEIRFQRYRGEARRDTELGRKAAAVVAFEDLNKAGQMCALDLLQLVSKIPEYQKEKD